MGAESGDKRTLTWPWLIRTPCFWEMGEKDEEGHPQKQPWAWHPFSERGGKGELPTSDLQHTSPRHHPPGNVATEGKTGICKMGPHWWSQPPLLEDPLQLQKPETPKFCAHSEQHLRPLWAGIWEFPQKEGTIPGRGDLGAWGMVSYWWQYGGQILPGC